MAELGAKTACRTPAEGRDGLTNVPTWKFDLVRSPILDAAADEIAFKDLSGAVAARLNDEDRAKLGSLGWHVTTVKLELEVRGEIARVPCKGPQRIRAV